LASVVLADNASTDRTIEVAKGAWPTIRIVQTGANLGYAAAINMGRQCSAPHDALVVLNPDATLQYGSLAALCSVLRRERCGIVVPRMTTSDGRLSWSLRRDPTVLTAFAEALLGGRCSARLGLGELVASPHRYAAEGPTQWATGAAVLITRQCWDAVGEWDPSFFLYSEETDYMMRARRAGFTVLYTPTADVRHRGGDSAVDPRLWALLVCNKTQLFSRTHGWLAGRMFAAALLLGQALRAPRSARARMATRALLFPETRSRVRAALAGD
jgi:GT2 family glycosyltransferase